MLLHGRRWHPNKKQPDPLKFRKAFLTSLNFYSLFLPFFRNGFSEGKFQAVFFLLPLFLLSPVLLCWLPLTLRQASLPRSVA